jgi:hypothetical protein
MAATASGTPRSASTSRRSSAKASASTAIAASWVVKVLVAGTATSVPASVTRDRSATSVRGDPSTLVTPTVLAPQSLAHSRVATISSVAPDCDTATASTPRRSMLAW